MGCSGCCTLPHGRLSLYVMLFAFISYLCIVPSTNGCFYVEIEGFLFDSPPYGSPSPNGARYGAGLYTYEDTSLGDYTCTIYSSDMIEDATYVDDAFHSARVFGGFANGLCGISVILLIVATCIEFSPKALKGVALCLIFASMFQWLTFVFFASALCDEFTSCDLSYGASFGIAGGIVAFMAGVLCFKIPPARDAFADDLEGVPHPQGYPPAERIPGTATLTETSLPDGTKNVTRTTVNADGSQTVEETVTTLQ